ncbi:MAG: tetratricopeptide repeat protein [Myxococcota bacterium]
MPDLNDEFMARIRKHTDQGEIWMEDGNFLGAADMFQKALTHVPPPITDYEASTWILTALGDARFLAGDYEGALDALTEAVQCPGGLGNPFIHLRLGQCQYEVGDMDRAADELARAYMGDGERIFETDDPKYLEFVKSKLDAPAPQAAAAGAPAEEPAGAGKKGMPGPMKGVLAIAIVLALGVVYMLIVGLPQQ